MNESFSPLGLSLRVSLPKAGEGELQHPLLFYYYFTPSPKERENKNNNCCPSPLVACERTRGLLRKGGQSKGGKVRYSIKTRETRLERATSYSQSKLLNQLGYSLFVFIRNLRNLRNRWRFNKEEEKKIFILISNYNVYLNYNFIFFL
jgi:hypothetical protein